MSYGLIIGISVGMIVGVALASSALFCIWYRRISSQTATAIPKRVNGADSSIILSNSTVGLDTPRSSDWNNMPLWLEGLKKNNVVPVSGLPKYSYKDLRKATHNFTTTIGQGAFGPVYKAQMSTGETVAVKVLANESRQGEKEFLTEVLLSGRLHHRNLVNLVGYCSEKGNHMLVYVYMSNGSLASHLYSENLLLSWDLRVRIALDVARGLEYLHYGATPPVIHRDIKSSNILLDWSMRARVADFGLSREEMNCPHASNVRGTFGYLDPEYMSTRTFTKKSDVYSFGVLLFELISGRDPQKGLMEYVELAVMDTEDKIGWEEIVDSRLDGKFDVKQLNTIASLAYKCTNIISKERPSIGDVVQTLSQILKLIDSRKHQKETWLSSLEEVCVEVKQSRRWNSL